MIWCSYLGIIDGTVGFKIAAIIGASVGVTIIVYSHYSVDPAK